MIDVGLGPIMEFIGLNLPKLNSADIDPFGNFLEIETGDTVIEILRTYQEDKIMFSEIEVKIFDKNYNLIYHNIWLDSYFTD